MWFWANDSNHKHIICCWNDFFPRLTIWYFYLKIRPRLARINCQIFYSLARKVCFEIQPLSSRTKGTIMIVGMKGTCWDHKPAVGMAGDGLFASLDHRRWQHFTVNEARYNLFGLPWFSSTGACDDLFIRAPDRPWLFPSKRERESDKEREREREK